MKLIVRYGKPDKKLIRKQEREYIKKIEGKPAAERQPLPKETK